MALLKQTQEMAVSEIAAFLPKKTGRKIARKIAWKKLKQALSDIQEFYDGDSLVLAKRKEHTPLLRKKHRLLAMRMLTSFPGTTSETAQQIMTELFPD